MSEKIIGILGGMGPEATLDLFYKIIKLSPAEKDQDHFRIIIDNNPKIPDRTDAILGTGKDPLPELIMTAQNLEKAGANFIIMPCNTAHYFISGIQQNVNIPILNMIKESANYVKNIFPSFKKAVLFASKGTYKTKLYNSFFNAKNIEILIPTPPEQDKIMDLIYMVKSGILSEEMKSQIMKISEEQIKKGAQVIIAGCTEIPLILKNEDVKIPVIDPTNILAKRAVKEAKNKK
jgi:aspartate racemase